MTEENGGRRYYNCQMGAGICGNLWQAKPFMTTKQTTPYAENYRLHAY
jgi:hypothetical protein